MSLLGIDLGSGSCKGVAFKEDGAILASALRSYSTYSPAPNMVQMDPELLWNAALEVIREINEQLDDPVEALAVSSHGETFIPLGKDGMPVYDAIMNSDNRADEIACGWEKSLGKEHLYSLTGLPLHTMFALNKIMWLKANLPDVYAKCHKFISAGDYIIARLGLGTVTDYSLACRTMAFDINKRSWSDEILNIAQIPTDSFPSLVPSGYMVGKISDEMARLTGLKKGVVVSTGGHDQPCGALGAGAISAGDVSDSAGTYECMAVTSDKPKNTGKALSYNFNSYCHVVPDKYVTLAFFPAGVVTRWFTDNLCGEDRINAKAQGISLYELLEREVHANCQGPTGLELTPHFVGSCNPYWDVRATGALYGITPNATRHHLYKAIFEGIACELAINIDALSQVIGDFDNIRIMGGNSRLDFTVQLRADISQKSFVTMDSPEAVCRGAAMLAGMAAGIYKDADDAVKTVKSEKLFVPNLETRQAYDKQLKKYKLLYHALEEIRGI